jgi:RNA polymerase sigma-70 factor (ECF subfamily)
MTSTSTLEASTHAAELRGLSPDVVALLVGSHARFLAFLERRVSSREVAEDILQEAFARALSRGDSLRAEESAVAWFYRLLRNAIIDHHRRTASTQRALDAVTAETPTSTVLDEELMATVCECMGELVDTLKPEYAEIIRRVDLDEGTVADYATASGITANNAGVRLHRAREALFKSLVRSCGTCASHGCLDCKCKIASCSTSP